MMRYPTTIECYGLWSICYIILSKKYSPTVMRLKMYVSVSYPKQLRKVISDTINPFFGLCNGLFDQHPELIPLEANLGPHS